jgi:hypothetical protein
MLDNRVSGEHPSVVNGNIPALDVLDLNYLHNINFMQSTFAGQ